MTAALKIYGGRRRRHCKALLRGLPRGSQVWLPRGHPRTSSCVALPTFVALTAWLLRTTPKVVRMWFLLRGSSPMVPPAWFLPRGFPHIAPSRHHVDYMSTSLMQQQSGRICCQVHCLSILARAKLWRYSRSDKKATSKYV